MELKDLVKIAPKGGDRGADLHYQTTGAPVSPFQIDPLTISAASEAVQVCALIAAAGAPLPDELAPQTVYYNVVAAIWQDDDAHEACTLTACLDPLHPGPCKGWKHTLFQSAPQAWHALESARVEKANARRVKRIEDLKAKGLPIPKKLLTPIVAKLNPHAGKTANGASGGAHEAGKAVSEAAGIHVNEPGKVSLGHAVKKAEPVELGPKGKKPTVASKGIAHVIAQEKVTPQYKLDKAATITPEQWNALSDGDKATIRDELAKVQKEGFGPQQKKATELISKFGEHDLKAKIEKAHAPETVTTPSGKVYQKVELKKPEPETPKAPEKLGAAPIAAHHTPPHPGQPLSAKNYTPAMASATDAADAYAHPPNIHALQTPFATRFKAYQKLNAEEWKALPEGTKTTIVKDMIEAVAADQQLHQGFIDETGKAFTPVSAWMFRRNIQVPALDQGKIDKLVPQFAKDKPVLPAVQVHIPEKTTVESKNIFGEHSHVTKVNHPKYGETPKAAEAPKLETAKPKELPKHVQDAVSMAKGQAPGASWAKHQLAAYQPLSADEFHALPQEHQDKIVSDLNKGVTKFLDPKKVAATKNLLDKFGHGEAPKPQEPKPEKTVDFAKDLHDHSVTKAQAKEAVGKTAISAHFLAAKQTAGLTDADNPDSTHHAKDAWSSAQHLADMQTDVHDSKTLGQPGVKEAVEHFTKQAAESKLAQNVQKAKSSAFNKISLKLANDKGELSPIEKASLEHYQNHLLNHPSKTDAATIGELQQHALGGYNDLQDKLQAAKKVANAPKAEDMSPAQIVDRAKELMGPGAAEPKIHLSLAEMQSAKKVGQATANGEALEYPKELLTDPTVAAKHGAVVNAATQLQATKVGQEKLAEHLNNHHYATLAKGYSDGQVPLSADDKKVIQAHADMIKASHSDYLGAWQADGEKKLHAAEAQFHAAASKAQGKPAEPQHKLTDFDKTTIEQAYVGAYSKHAVKAASYGVKTYEQKTAMKEHPEYKALGQDLGNLRTLAGKIALAHAHEHTAELNVPVDPETGAMEHGDEELTWKAAATNRAVLEGQFKALHADAQAKLDKIRSDVGLNKRALPKADAPAVKATAAETGYYKSTGYGAPNYGKASSGKQYMLAKVGPKLAVAHQSSAEKKLDKLADAPPAPVFSPPKKTYPAMPSTEAGKLPNKEAADSHGFRFAEAVHASDMDGWPPGGGPAYAASGADLKALQDHLGGPDTKRGIAGQKEFEWSLDNMTGKGASSVGKGALYGYTGSGSGPINEKLNGLPPGAAAPPNSSIARIDKAMADSPPLASDVVLYRGFSDPHGTFKSGKWNDVNVSGMEWTQRSYSSTSGALSTAQSFAGYSGGVVMRVIIPKEMQVKGISAKGGQHPGENEIILQRGLRYRVVADYGKHNNRRYIDVMVVPSPYDKAE